MELIVSVGFPNGNFSGKFETFAEASEFRKWLISERIIDAPPAAPVDDGAHEAELAEAVEAAQAPAEKPAAKPRAAKPKAPPAAPVDEAGEPVTIQDVTKAVTDYAAAQGPTEARALFARFGVSRGGDLKPEQFADFVKTATDYTARGIKATDAQMPEGADLM